MSSLQLKARSLLERSKSGSKAYRAVKKTEKEMKEYGSIEKLKLADWTTETIIAFLLAYDAKPRRTPLQSDTILQKANSVKRVFMNMNLDVYVKGEIEIRTALRKYTKERLDAMIKKPETKKAKIIPREIWKLMVLKLFEEGIRDNSKNYKAQFERDTLMLATAWAASSSGRIAEILRMRLSDIVGLGGPDGTHGLAKNYEWRIRYGKSDRFGSKDIRYMIYANNNEPLLDPIRMLKLFLNEWPERNTEGAEIFRKFDRTDLISPGMITRGWAKLGKRMGLPASLIPNANSSRVGNINLAKQLGICHDEIKIASQWSSHHMLKVYLQKQGDSMNGVYSTLASKSIEELDAVGNGMLSKQQAKDMISFKSNKNL